LHQNCCGISLTVTPILLFKMLKLLWSPLAEYCPDWITIPIVKLSSSLHLLFLCLPCFLPSTISTLTISP
jgi:hypothetical protein